MALMALQAGFAQAALFGMTPAGGADGLGTIFKINPDGSGYALLHGFSTPTSGAFPEYGALTKAANGQLYGMTSRGGQFGAGVLFEYDPLNNAYTKKKDFNGYDGANPFGTLTEFNGKLYGLTSGDMFWGGVNSLFEYDPASDACVTYLDFDHTNGAHPSGDLIVFDPQAVGVKNTEVLVDLSLFPNPATDQLTIINRGNAGGWLSLVQADGRVVAKLQLQGQIQHRVDVADVPPGLLFWQWAPGSEGATQTGSVMVVR